MNVRNRPVADGSTNLQELTLAGDSQATPSDRHGLKPQKEPRRNFVTGQIYCTPSQRSGTRTGLADLARPGAPPQ